MAKTIEELLEMTRPVAKGNRFRGKTLKSRHKAKPSSIKGSANDIFSAPLGVGIGLSSLAAQLSAQQAERGVLRQSQALQNAAAFQRAQAQRQGQSSVGWATMVRRARHIKKGFKRFGKKTKAYQVDTSKGKATLVFPFTETNVRWYLAEDQNGSA